MKQFLVIGLGKFGISVAKTLYENDGNVLAIDSDEDLVQEAINTNVIDNAVAIDATDSVELKNLGVNNFDVAFVCVGTNIQDSILITLTLKELGVPRVVAKAKTLAHGKVLSKIGADEIIYPETYMGKRVALQEIEPSIVEHMKFSDEYMLLEIKAPSAFYTKTLEGLEIRKKYKVNIIAIKDEKGKTNVAPMGDTIINEGDILIMVTDNKTAKKLKSLK